MSIQGPLRELGIHDVFQLLDLGRKTGRLRITSELRQNEGVIWFHEAAVVGATIRSNPHPLGTTLLRAGKVRQEDLTRARAMQEGGDERLLGEILVDIGAIAKRELEQQIRGQIEEVVFTVLGWSEGHFVFEDVTPDEIPVEGNVKISTESLLLEAARRIDEWSEIKAKVPHLGVIPRLAASNDADPGSLVLEPFEWRILARTDGNSDVRTIARLLGRAEFDVARALFGLASAGVIVLYDPAADSAVAAHQQDPASMLQQGEEHLRLGDAESARLMADAVTGAFPDEVGGYMLLGRAWLLEHRYREAVDAFREVLHREKLSAAGLRLMGLALVGAARFDEAVEAWERWMKLDIRPESERKLEGMIQQHLDAALSLRAGLRERHG